TANGVVPRRLMPIFRDQQDLSAGADLAEEIKAALAASQFLVVLCSPTAATSRWTNAEIESFKRTRPEGCVLAAVAAGEPFASEVPGREHEECFPPALRYKYDRRGHQTAKRAEPLAADFRENHDGRKLAFLKLVAGMLGVGLDELVQRETTRRHRRLAWLAAGSLAGMAVTSTLALAAFQARNEAREQRRQAERLVEYMVGDLRDKLEPIGKLDVLDGVGTRVLAYYRNQDTSTLTDDALLQRSRALNLMAEVAYNRGNLQEAEQLYRQATAGTAEAVRRSPEDPKRLFDHAQNIFWVGEVARNAGRPSEAEAAWRDYKRLADRMSALAPDNLKYRMEVLYADENLGISVYDQHRFAEAEQLFEGAAGPTEKLASLYPANETYRNELAIETAWIADAVLAQAKFDQAIAARQRQISLLSRATESFARADLIFAYEGLGVLFDDRGDADRATNEMQAAVGEAQDFMALEPRNADWKSRAALVHFELARILLSARRVQEAAQQTSVGCGLTAELPAAFKFSWGARLQTNCPMMRSRLALADGDTKQARPLAEIALAAVRREHSEDPVDDRYRVAQAYRLLGDVRKQDGDAEGARAAWNAALAQLPSGVAELPNETNERVQLLQRLERTAKAGELAARLNAKGYRRVN
ncbi:MAG TPA: toll/interleukin-1 receptor domain-containing protein, partial [Sphingomicrobium sp.]|nr:toll/interleukin-1 receptor domain-containing protein [Sphingomicrobium sp.]